MKQFFPYFLTLTLALQSSSTVFAYREVECRVVKAGEPCEWVYKDQAYPPAIRPTTPTARTPQKSYSQKKVVITHRPAIQPTKVITITPQSPQAMISPTKEIPEGVLAGHVVEKHYASTPLFVQTFPPNSIPVSPKKPIKTRKREQITQDHSWIARMSLDEALQLSEFVAEVICHEVKQTPGVLALNDPPLNQAGQPFSKALIQILRTQGYSIAGQDTLLLEAHHIRYRITKLDKHSLLVRVKVDKTEYVQAYRRNPQGALVAMSAMTTIQEIN